MRNAAIASGARTPMGKFGGAFKDVSAHDWAAAIRAALARADAPPETVNGGRRQRASGAGSRLRRPARRAQLRHAAGKFDHRRQPAVFFQAGGDNHGGAAGADGRGGYSRRRRDGKHVAGAVHAKPSRAIRRAANSGDGTPRDGLTEGLGCPVNMYRVGATAENGASALKRAASRGTSRR